MVEAQRQTGGIPHILSFETLVILLLDLHHPVNPH